MKIVSFGHRKGVGKDLATRLLSQELRLAKPGCSILVSGFATKLKDIAYQLYSWAGLKPAHYYETDREAKERILEKIGLSPRDIYIGVGNGLRSFYENTWLDYLFNISSVDYLFVSDLRFPNEAESILNRNGLLYRIDRPGCDYCQDGADDKLEEYDKWTKIIKNDSGIKEFHSKLMTTILPEIIK